MDHVESIDILNVHSIDRRGTKLVSVFNDDLGPVADHLVQSFSYLPRKILSYPRGKDWRDQDLCLEKDETPMWSSRLRAQYNFSFTLQWNSVKIVFYGCKGGLNKLELLTDDAAKLLSGAIRSLSCNAPNGDTWDK